MIKLRSLNYDRSRVYVIYLSKSEISRIERDEKENITYITTKDEKFHRYVLETPEEILAMPDIETKEKVIDWEQRRYEIANNVIGRILSVPYFLAAAKGDPIESLVLVSVRIADALIDVLKKGQDNEN